MITQAPPQPSTHDWMSIADQFQSIVGAKSVVRRREELLVYECDGLTSYRQRPALVVLPRTTEEVAEIIRICHEQKVPFVARGSGTGFSGGALPIEDCILITTTLMREIINIDYENQCVTVQPGVINNWVT